MSCDSVDLEKIFQDLVTGARKINDFCRRSNKVPMICFNNRMLTDLKTHLRVARLLCPEWCRSSWPGRCAPWCWGAGTCWAAPHPGCSSRRSANSACRRASSWKASSRGGGDIWHLAARRVLTRSFQLQIPWGTFENLLKRWRSRNAAAAFSHKSCETS